MLLVNNAHILSANRKCLITDGEHKVAGIRALLTNWGFHIILDGTRPHLVTEVVFVPSTEWAAAVGDDPDLFDEAERAVRAVGSYPGTDFETPWAWDRGPPVTSLRAAIDLFQGFAA